ncbi:MAG: putative beta-lysine N-acetyltransferase [Deltaproteobacteria bacterium]|nr:putative beta-lysine N-acetyltransferase [Deltaproteobacteria bacterium]
MRPDTLISMPGATLQHGPASDRVYLMKLSSVDATRIIRFMDRLATANGYSKLFAKVPGAAESRFTAKGFRVEARVPAMYGGREDGCFMAKYPDQKRSRIADPQRVRNVLDTALRQEPRSSSPTPPPGWTCRRMAEADVDDMATLYRLVFETYPFPIHDPDYLRSTMRASVRYFGMLDDQGRVVALASAEMDTDGKNAEMTDFATQEDCRGKGLASALLARMERDMAQAGIRTAFTIARAHATGMNVVFSRQGYTFAGTLPNNTQIKGDLESMNVWYKYLDTDDKTQTV